MFYLYGNKKNLSKEILKENSLNKIGNKIILPTLLHRIDGGVHRIDEELGSSAFFRFGLHRDWHRSDEAFIDTRELFIGSMDTFT